MQARTGAVPAPVQSRDARDFVIAAGAPSASARSMSVVANPRVRLLAGAALISIYLQVFLLTDGSKPSRFFGPKDNVKLSLTKGGITRVKIGQVGDMHAIKARTSAKVSLMGSKANTATARLATIEHERASTNRMGSERLIPHRAHSFSANHKTAGVVRYFWEKEDRGDRLLEDELDGVVVDARHTHTAIFAGICGPLGIRGPAKRVDYIVGGELVSSCHRP